MVMIAIYTILQLFLSNAIGFKKSIIIADNVNPEILKKFNIGMAFENGNFDSLKNTLELFVNNYYDNKINVKHKHIKCFHQLN